MTTPLGLSLGADVDMMLATIRPTVYAIAQAFGFTDVGGWREKDPYPDHPGRYAADYMTHGDRAKGDRLANWSTVHAQEIGLDYQIWWGRVWDADKDAPGLPWERWRPYSGSNPHTDHVHQTYRKTGGTQLLGLQNLGDSAVGKLFDLDGFMSQVEGTSVTLLAAGLGIVLLGVGITMSVRSTVAKQAKKAGIV